MTRTELHWNWNGEDIPVTIEAAENQGTLSVKGKTIPFEILERTTHGIRISAESKNYETYVVRDGRETTVWCNGVIYRLESHEQRTTQAASPSVGSDVRAPMAGKVTRVEVAVGDIVTELQVVAVLESMKMETSLHASASGRVTEVRVKPGDVVEMGEVLIVTEPAA